MVNTQLEIQQVVEEHQELTQYECYRAVVTHFKTHCFNWHDQQVHTHTHLKRIYGHVPS